jgi:hypothetical protein
MNKITQSGRAVNEKKALDHAVWLARLVGRELGQDAWLQSKARSQRLTRQSEEIAARLEAQGITARRPRSEWVAVVGRGGEAEVLPGSQYRHVQFIPAVMATESRQWCRDLQHFLDAHEFCRMWVLTSGRRCKVGEIGQRLGWMSRKISALARVIKAKWGIEAQAARTEITIKAEPDGSHSFHPHTHLIVMPTRTLTKSDWNNALRYVHRRMGTHWSDCGRIRDAAECGKYLAKIDDTEEGDGCGILSLSDAELAELARQLFHRQLSRRMGRFARECRDRQTRGVRIRKTPDEQGVWRWAEVAKPKIDARQRPNGSGRSANIVIGRTVCTFRRPVLEAGLLVLNYDGDYAKLLRLRFGGDEDAAFGTGAIKVHTRTKIGQTQTQETASAAHAPP